MTGSRPELGIQRVERVTVRVTGIEPALSAWETNRSGPLTALTWTSDVPLVTMTDPVTPGLMARVSVSALGRPERQATLARSDAA
jgi:hypothetical protein